MLEHRRTFLLVEFGGVGARQTLVERFLDRVAPLLQALDAGRDWGAPAPDFTGFDEAARRGQDAAGPDAETLVRVRGDRNRAFLMD